MKKSRMFALGVTLVIVLALTGFAPVQRVPEGAIDIVFDGYCDGMLLNIPSVGLGTRPTVDGHRTGCASDSLIGTSSVKTGVAVSFYPGFLIHTVVRTDFTWTHYAASGDLIYILNAGTWSYGTPQDAGAASTTG